MNEEHLKDTLARTERRLNDHSGRIDRLENKQAETNVKIDNLCKSIDGLTSTMKWLLGVIITSLGAFFIWVIQNNLIK